MTNQELRELKDSLCQIIWMLPEKHVVTLAQHTRELSHNWCDEIDQTIEQFQKQLDNPPRIIRT